MVKPTDNEKYSWQNSNSIKIYSKNDCENVMNLFYERALSSNWNEQQEKKVYRVFIGRRSFVKACMYIRDHHIDEEICETVFSDIGFRVLVAKLGRYLAHAVVHRQIDQFFKNRIFLYDDILIHGRALSGLLSAAEEIFITAFREASLGIDIPREVLSSSLLSLITIQTAIHNSHANLLSTRFNKLIDNTFSEELTPDLWRQFSTKIAEEIYTAPIPNAAFMPAVIFESDSGFREALRQRFLITQDSNAAKVFRISENIYRGRSMDSYIFFLTDGENLNAAFTLRCTDSYLIPFVFLPEMDKKQFAYLTNRIVEKIKQHSQELGENLSTLFGKQRLQFTRQLSVFYSELVNMILGTAMLRSFLKGLHQPVHDSKYKLDTTAVFMLYNYAHDSVVKELLAFLFDESFPPLFSLDELIRLVSETVGKENCIFNGISDITDIPCDKSVTIKVVNYIERVAFQYGIDSEKTAYELAAGSLSPSVLSLQYFLLPTENTLPRVLKKIYRYKDSWIRNSASLYDVFSYMLQLMDYGCLSLTTGERDCQMVQCLKAGEQSMTLQLYRFSVLLPLLYEIEKRCVRKNILPQYHFYEEMALLIRAGENRTPKRRDVALYIQMLKRYRVKIFYIAYKLFDSGQSIQDYLFLLDKQLKDTHAKISIEEYCRYFENLYNMLIYGAKDGENDD